MGNFDLKSAYHHISIFTEHRQYLGFQWNNCMYIFNVLPFGLSPAGYIFTKLTRPLLKNWRDSGHKILLYLDDGIFMSNTFRGCVNSGNSAVFLSHLQVLIISNAQYTLE